MCVTEELGWNDSFALIAPVSRWTSFDRSDKAIVGPKINKSSKNSGLKFFTPLCRLFFDLFWSG